VQFYAKADYRFAAIKAGETKAFSGAKELFKGLSPVQNKLSIDVS